MGLGNLSVIIGSDISGLTAGLATAQTELLETCTLMGEGIESFGAEIAALSPLAGETMEGVNGAFGQFAGILESALTNPLVLASAAVLGIGTAAFEAGETFEDASITIQRATGATGDALDALEESASNLYSSLPVDMQTVASTLDTLTQRTGLTGDALDDLATTFINLGIDTGQSSSEMAQSFTGMAKMWQLDGDQMTEVANQLYVVFQKTGAPIPALVDSLSSAGPVLQALGFSIQDAAAMMGSFNDQNVTAQQVTAGLRTLYKQMTAQDIPDMGAQFLYLAQNIQNADNMQDAMSEGIQIFGPRGAALAAAIYNGALSFDQLREAMDNAGNSINDTANKTLSLGQQWTLLKNSTEALLAPIGQFLVGAMQSLVNVLQLAVQAWDNFKARAELIGLLIGSVTGNWSTFVSAVTSGNDATNKATVGMGAMGQGMAAAGLAAAGLATATNSDTTATIGNTTAKNQGFQTSTQLAAAKKAEAAAVKANAEQVSYETAVDTINNQILADRNKTIDQFTARMTAIVSGLQMWTQQDVNWGNVTEGVYEQAVADVLDYQNSVVQAYQFTGNAALQYMNSVIGWNNLMVANGLQSTQQTYSNLEQAYDAYTQLAYQYYAGLTSNDNDFYNATTQKLAQLKAYAAANWQGMTQDQQTQLTAQIQQTQDAYDQIVQTTSGHLDQINAAYAQLGLKTAAQLQTQVTNNAAALDTILADTNSTTTQQLQAEIAYYKSVLALDQQTNSSMVSNDQAALAALEAQLNNAAGPSGLMTQTWDSFWKDIQGQEKQFGSVIANDLFSGSGSVLQRLGAAFQTIGEDIAKSMITAPIQTLVDYISKNLINGTLFSQLGSLFTSFGTTVSNVFGGIQQDFQNLVNWIGGGSGVGATGQTPGISLPGVGSIIPGSSSTGSIDVTGGGLAGAGTGADSTAGLGGLAGDAGDAGDAGLSASIGDAGDAGLGDVTSSLSGSFSSAFSSIAGAITGAIGGIIGGAISAITTVIEAHDQDKIFENIQTDTDLLRQYAGPGGWMPAYRDWTMNWLWADLLPALVAIDTNAFNLLQFTETWVVDNCLQPMQKSLASLDTNVAKLASQTWTMTNNWSVSIDDVNSMATDIAQAILTQLQLAGLKVASGTGG